MNFEMGALNVMTVPVDQETVSSFAPLAHRVANDAGFAVLRPTWNSDIQWISANTPETFARFQSAFDRLGVAAHVTPYLDLDSAPRLYAGFVLVRSKCTDTNFHFDWIDTGNEAFTLITPMDERIHGFGLVYEKVTGAIGEYDYSPGEAVIFGEKFLHSTKPGQSDEPVAMLCFQFGTDKMTKWDKILETAGYQSHLIQRPDGQFAVRDGDSWRTISQSAP
jgi:hypothetical protein